MPPAEALKLETDLQVQIMGQPNQMAAVVAGMSKQPAAFGDPVSSAAIDAVHLKRVIPCLDVAEGRVVKGTNFVNLRDAGDPVELAERYDAEGADELVFLDITATSDARDTIVDLARRTADNVFIPFTIGAASAAWPTRRRCWTRAPTRWL